MLVENFRGGANGELQVMLRTFDTLRHSGLLLRVVMHLNGERSRFVIDGDHFAVMMMFSALFLLDTFGSFGRGSTDAQTQNQAQNDQTGTKMHG